VAPSPSLACRLRVSGVVQGVGFRPFVHRLAATHGLAGWVRNESGDVHIHIEGHGDDLDAFVAELPAAAPPLAAIESVERLECAPAGPAGFTVAGSTGDPALRQPVPPDVAICDACQAELVDPADRRYRYPFIAGADRGPRYSVIESLPYD